MKVTKLMLPLFLVGSIAVAQQAPPKTTPQTTPPAEAVQAKGAKMTPPADAATAMSTSKAKAAKTIDAADAKITKEQAGTIAMGEKKGSEVVSSELKEVGGNNVWAVTLKSGKHTSHVLVDATTGSVVKTAKHMTGKASSTTKHTMHKKSAKSGSEN
jgi:uncharacterized membrane protein YkoI